MARFLRGRTSRLSAKVVIRCFWIVMVALHMPALIGACRALLGGDIDAVRLVGGIGLAAATVFFLLKLRGVSFLKFGTDRRTGVVLVAAVALMHAEVVGAVGDLSSSSKTIPLAATSLFATGFVRVQRFIGTLLTHDRDRQTPRKRSLQSVATAGMTAFTPHGWFAAGCLFVPRAPPA